MSPLQRRLTQPARMLASVTSVREAELAHAGGADIIDCKDPARGALGALDLRTVAAIRARLPNAAISATIGDLPAQADVLLPSALAMAATGVDYVKVGFFPGGDAVEAIAALGSLFPTPRPRGVGQGEGRLPTTALAAVLHESIRSTPHGSFVAAPHPSPLPAGGERESARLVGVLLADRDPDLALVPLMAAAGFAAVLIDTAGKDGRSLPDIIGPEALATFIEAAHAVGLAAGLAGSLRLEHLPGLLALGPDLVGFRGALCLGSDRTAAIDQGRVARVRAAFDPTDAPARRHEELAT